MATPYWAALDEEWDKLKDFCEKQGAFVLKSIQTTADDTLFHLAVFSKSEEPLKSLLDIAKGDPWTKRLYSKKNIYGNTALHEAAADGNIKAVRLLMQHDKELLKDRNEEGETPLFKAAAYGQTEGSETALMLLKLDKSLATLEDGDGITSLELLATMPSAFRSGYRMSMWKRLLYFCPLIDAKRRIGLPILRRILKYKRKHNLAFKLTLTLIDKDATWVQIAKKRHSDIFQPPGNKIAIQAEESEVSKPIALFLATERGILEIVKEILKQTPQLA
ncbi:uncharacterized protein LOC116107056 [Pistacia vera]|uniref:uncharacterized protein LOC116107056 n=1 Tax=Pistacia vera TaxID=55513 RepID=UPI001263BF7C|nr:uncharacterized protein LOC116107056 [Pistacia vera]